MRTRLRAVVFVVLACFIVGGPFYRQVLKGRNKGVRNWVMFAGKGTGFIDATFYARRSGHDVEIDRFAVLGHEKKPKSRYWLIRDERSFGQLTQTLCRKTGEDVRVDARIATRRGWRELTTTEEPACRQRRN